MHDLEQYFKNNNKRLIHNWSHYFEIYERYFSRYRGKEVIVLEIGVFQGGSLQMWEDYFRAKLKSLVLILIPNAKHWKKKTSKFLSVHRKILTF